MTCLVEKEETTTKAEKRNRVERAKNKVAGQPRRSDHLWTSSKDITISFFLLVFLLTVTSIHLSAWTVTELKVVCFGYTNFGMSNRSSKNGSLYE